MKLHTSWFVLALTLALSAAPWARAQEDLSAENLARAKAATVLVDLGRQGSGSGFLVDPCGLFATNRHVAEAAQPGATIKLALNSGQADQRIVSARVVALSEDADLALLKTDEPVKAEPLKLSDDTGLTELAKTIVFGYPYGKMLAEGGEPYPAISINVGRISSLRREGGKLERIQMDAATNPGNSGGPVLDKDGRVVGIVVSGIPGASVNFAIPAAKLLAMIKQPVLSLRAPEIAYAHRGDSRDFEVEVLPTAPIPTDAQVVLKLGETRKEQRSFPAQRSNGKWILKAAPCDTSGAPGFPRLRLEADFGAHTVMSNVDDCPIRIGNQQLRLSEVRGMDRRKGKETTILTHLNKDTSEFDTVPGWVYGMPMLHGEYNNMTLDLNTAQHIRIGAYDPGLVKMPWELVMTSKGQAVANARGTLNFTDTPRSLDPDDDVKRSGGHGMKIKGLTLFFRSISSEGFRTDGLIEPAKDARAGTWTRNSDGLLETGAEQAAWCDVPAIPTTDYQVNVKFTPKQKGRGELDLQLPIGKARALLHINGEKGAMSLDVANVDEGDETKARIPAFEKDKELDAEVTVEVHDKYARIVVTCGDANLFWVGNIKRLAEPKDVPADLAPLALGQHDLEMTLNSLEIGTEDGGLRIMREIAPGVRRTAEWLLGLYPLDVAPKGKKIHSSADRGVVAVTIGSPEIGVQPAALGAGAMRLKGDSSGLQLEENEYTNKGSYPGRTVSFWFCADAPDAPNARQYLFDEGGSDKGYAIYLENGAIFAGGWDIPGNWKGTWFTAPGIVANQWHHVALIINGKEKEKDKAFFLMLDGNEIARGFGKTMGPHEPIVFGTTQKTTRFREDPPPNPEATNQSFRGMMDEVEIYNTNLGRPGQHIMAGGRFLSKPVAKK